jgi:hypothetical protein
MSLSTSSSADERLEPFDDAAQAAPWPLPPAPADTLNRAADKAADRRFTGEPITGFGALS